jgi:ankyrin repeat protein
MFNFLFEGKLGEYLAPNSSSPLFAAIQKNEADTIQNILSTASTIDLCKMDDTGYSAVHVACRFNNMFALQLIFSRGVHVVRYMLI